MGRLDIGVLGRHGGYILDSAFSISEICGFLFLSIRVIRGFSAVVAPDFVSLVSFVDIAVVPLLPTLRLRG